MPLFTRTNVPSLIGITCAVIIFGIAGFFHLGQFETADEHLWKYDRVPQYWQALAARDWAKTYINDKPGVTVALFSGIGLLYEPNPNATQFAPHPHSTSDDAPSFKKYDTIKSEAVNVAFRAPIIILGMLTIIGIFLLLRIAFDTRVAALAALLIGTNPILIGMSQIINPDAFFWMFGALGIAAYLALVRTSATRYVLLTGIFTGFALLSKYTSFTLFVFYILISISALLFDKPLKKTTIATYVTTFTIRLSAIAAIAFSTFIIFLPASIARPEIILRGIGQFLPEGRAVPVVLALMAIIIGAWYILTRYGERILHTLRTYAMHSAVVVSMLFLGTIGFALLNTWTGQRIIPFDNLRGAVYANEPARFNFKPYIHSTAKKEKRVKAYFTNAYPLTFSLTPIIFFSAILGGAWFTLHRRHANQRIRIFFVTLATFTLIYLLLTVKAKVIINVRYTILLYPLFAILAALVIDHLVTRYSARIHHATSWTLAILLLIGAGTLWHIAPFYFSYATNLLPRAFSIHDSWGHGGYEAAQYLNNLPNAQDLIIYSNSSAPCRFFVGTCLTSRKIDLAVVTPDYFVMNKRDILKERNRIILLNNPEPEKDANYYIDNLSTKAIWRLDILNRPTNFVSIIPYERPH